MNGNPDKPNIFADYLSEDEQKRFRQLYSAAKGGDQAAGMDLDRLGFEAEKRHSQDRAFWQGLANPETSSQYSQQIRDLAATRAPDPAQQDMLDQQVNQSMERVRRGIKYGALRYEQALPFERAIEQARAERWWQVQQEEREMRRTALGNLAAGEALTMPANMVLDIFGGHINPQEGPLGFIGEAMFGPEERYERQLEYAREKHPGFTSFYEGALGLAQMAPGFGLAGKGVKYGAKGIQAAFGSPGRAVRRGTAAAVQGLGVPPKMAARAGQQVAQAGQTAATGALYEGGKIGLSKTLGTEYAQDMTGLEALGHIGSTAAMLAPVPGIQRAAHKVLPKATSRIGAKGRQFVEHGTVGLGLGAPEFMETGDVARWLGGAAGFGAFGMATSKPGREHYRKRPTRTQQLVAESRKKRLERAKLRERKEFKVRRPVMWQGAAAKPPEVHLKEYRVDKKKSRRLGPALNEAAKRLHVRKDEWRAAKDNLPYAKEQGEWLRSKIDKKSRLHEFSKKNPGEAFDLYKQYIKGAADPIMVETAADYFTRRSAELGKMGKDQLDLMLHVSRETLKADASITDTGRPGIVKAEARGADTLISHIKRIRPLYDAIIRVSNRERVPDGKGGYTYKRIKPEPKRFWHEVYEYAYTVNPFISKRFDSWYKTSEAAKDLRKTFGTRPHGAFAYLGETFVGGTGRFKPVGSIRQYFGKVQKIIQAALRNVVRYFGKKGTAPKWLQQYLEDVYQGRIEAVPATRAAEPPVKTPRRYEKGRIGPRMMITEKSGPRQYRKPHPRSEWQWPKKGLPTTRAGRKYAARLRRLAASRLPLNRDVAFDAIRRLRNALERRGKRPMSSKQMQTVESWVKKRMAGIKWKRRKISDKESDAIFAEYGTARGDMPRAEDVRLDTQSREVRIGGEIPSSVDTTKNVDVGIGSASGAKNPKDMALKAIKESMTSGMADISSHNSTFREWFGDMIHWAQFDLEGLSGPAKMLKMRNEALKLLKKAENQLDAGGRADLTNPEGWGKAWKEYKEARAKLDAEEAAPAPRQEAPAEPEVKPLYGWMGEPPVKGAKAYHHSKLTDREGNPRIAGIVENVQGKYNIAYIFPRGDLAGFRRKPINAHGLRRDFKTQKEAQDALDAYAKKMKWEDVPAAKMEKHRTSIEAKAIERAKAEAIKEEERKHTLYEKPIEEITEPAEKAHAKQREKERRGAALEKANIKFKEEFTVDKPSGPMRFVRGEIDTAKVYLDPPYWQMRKAAVGKEGVDPEKDLRRKGEKFDKSTPAAEDILIWVSRDGVAELADGHHRLALAKRDGVKTINALFLFETDGVPRELARFEAGRRNIVNESMEVMDAARFVVAAREVGLEPGEIVDYLGRGTRLYYQGEGWSKPMLKDALHLSKLSREALAMVENGEVSAKRAKEVGRLIENPDIQMEAMKGLARSESLLEGGVTDFVNKYAQAATASKATQEDIFGGKGPQTVTTFEQEANIAAKVRGKIKENRSFAAKMLRQVPKAQRKDWIEGEFKEGEVASEREFQNRLLKAFETFHDTGSLKKFIARQAAEVAKGEIDYAEATNRTIEHLIQNREKIVKGGWDAVVEGKRTGPDVVSEKIQSQSERAQAEGKLFDPDKKDFRLFSTDDIPESKETPKPKNPVKLVQKMAEQVKGKATEWKQRVIEREIDTSIGTDLTGTREAHQSAMRAAENKRAKEESTNVGHRAQDRVVEINDGPKGNWFRTAWDLFKKGKPESSFWGLPRMRQVGDLAKAWFSPTYWMGNPERIISSPAARQFAMAELESRAEYKAVKHDLELAGKTLNDMAWEDLGRALDGLRSEKDGARASSSEIAAFVQERAAYWRHLDKTNKKGELVSGWETSYKKWRELFDRHRAWKAKIARKDLPEMFGPRDYFPHVFDWTVDPITGITRHQSVELPKYARGPGRHYFYDKSMLPRFRNKPGYTLDPRVVLYNHLPATIKYLHMERVQDGIHKMIHGGYRNMSKYETNEVIRMLDELPRGYEDTIDKPGNEHKFVKYLLPGLQEFTFYKVNTLELPKGTKLYDPVQKIGRTKAEKAARGAKFVKGELPLKEIDPSLIRGSMKTVNESGYVFLKAVGQKPGFVIRVPIRLKTKNGKRLHVDRMRMFADGIQSLNHPNRLKAANKWIERNFGKEELKDLHAFQKTLLSFFDAYVGWAYHSTIGLWNVSTGMTNALGGQVSNFRILGPYYHKEGFKAWKGINKPEYADLKKMIEETGIFKSGEHWTLDRYDPTIEKGWTPKYALRQLNKAHGKVRDLSFMWMRITESFNRAPAACGAFVRATTPLNKGGLGMKWDANLSKEANLSHARTIAEQYFDPILHGKRAKGIETKADAEAVFKRAVKQEMIGVVQQAQLLYGGMSPTVFTLPYLRPFTHLQQWTVRYLDRTMMEDIPDFLTGRDPMKLIRNFTAANLLWAAGRMFWLDDDFAVNLSPVTGERVRDWPFLEDLKVIQAGMPASWVGDIGTPLQIPFAISPPVQITGALLTALQTTLSGNAANMFDIIRKKYGNQIAGLIVGRTVMSAVDIFTAGESGDPDNPLRLYYAKSPWEPGERQPKLDTTWADAIYQAVFPGQTIYRQKRYDLGRVDWMVRNELSDEKVKEEAWKLIKGGKKAEAEMLLKPLGLTFTRADASRIEKRKQQPAWIRQWTGLSVQDRVDSLVRRLDARTVTARDLKYALDELKRSKSDIPKEKVRALNKAVTAWKKRRGAA